MRFVCAGGVLLSCGRTPVFPWNELTGTPSGDESGDDEPGRGWLVTIDTNGYQLLRVDAEEGSTEVICALEDDGARYTSLAFGPGGRLYASYKVDASDSAPDRVAILDPCTCEKRVLVELAFGGAAGLAWSGDTLYALSHARDELLELDPETGTPTVVGSTGVDIRNHGASWSAAHAAVLVLEGSADRLYRLDVRTGRAEIEAEFAFDFSTVGFEVHPETGRMYACTGGAVLYEIDAAAGRVVAVGSLGHSGNCGNLAAVRGSVECVGT